MERSNSFKRLIDFSLHSLDDEFPILPVDSQELPLLNRSTMSRLSGLTCSGNPPLDELDLTHDASLPGKELMELGKTSEDMSMSRTAKSVDCLGRSFSGLEHLLHNDWHLSGEPPVSMCDGGQQSQELMLKYLEDEREAISFFGEEAGEESANPCERVRREYEDESWKKFMIDESSDSDSSPSFPLSTPVKVKGPATESGASQQHPKVMVVEAKYMSTDSLKVQPPCCMSRDSIAMASSRRQWLEVLRSAGTGGGGRGGEMRAAGVILGEHHQVLRRVFAMAPDPSRLPSSRPLVRVHLNELAPKVVEEEDVSLARPCFSPFEPGLMAVATCCRAAASSSSEQTDRVCVLNVARSPLAKISCAASSELPPCRYVSLGWISAQELLAAVGSRMVVMKYGEGTMKTRYNLAKIHDDEITDVKVTCLVLARHYASMERWGGVGVKEMEEDEDEDVEDDAKQEKEMKRRRGGRGEGERGRKSERRRRRKEEEEEEVVVVVVVVEEEEKACGGVIKECSSRRLSENSVYRAKGKLPSCHWNPSLAKMASAVTDCGVFHVFDIRAGKYERNVVVQVRSQGFSFLRTCDYCVVVAVVVAVVVVVVVDLVVVDLVVDLVVLVSVVVVIIVFQC
ncbi:hypothetical protein GUITHDRAFT_109240 [Guillardia theta CCMP2712]|uniref:Uncharacterized protein n=1 Tax=Guillardia theta (strain CCMP2712) TaxID=905079 RepID=L1J9Q0_GUITC|nr:hypothetical protein GUITHDRAFT_109240 [Guillardia theta CCMP2712]EKX44814.1 hypothetical protein GUITHDRAFT_109240 [Guillardia theta CCMP2712]|eukprot:XP_005831794.1 hypothetical protein GUITHDRAFT_109240 [Guillardia theta CCMP2712]